MVEVTIDTFNKFPAAVVSYFLYFCIHSYSPHHKTNIVASQDVLDSVTINTLKSFFWLHVKICIALNINYNEIIYMKPKNIYQQFVLFKHYSDNKIQGVMHPVPQ